MSTERGVASWKYYPVIVVALFAASIVFAGLYRGLLQDLALLLAGAFAGELLKIIGVIDQRSAFRGFAMIAVVLVIVLLGFWLGLRYSMSRSRNEVMRYPRADGLVADFTSGKGGPARSALGTQFSLFSDSAWNHQSKVWYERRDEAATGGQGFLRLYYQLEPSSTPSESYVGIDVDFSGPPPVPYDLSWFHKISLRIKNEPSSPDAVDVAVILYSTNVTTLDYAFPIWQIPRQNIRSEWTTVTATFDEFHRPSFADHEVQLDITHIYRIALMISPSGGPVHGHIDVDDLRFR